MAIDLDAKVCTSGFHLKWMTVKRLKEILSELEDEDLLYANRVGNLTVGRDGIYQGYIDFNSEVYEDFDSEIY